MPDKTRPARQKIGIFAGTFDPVHHGHLGFARQALQECGLDKVYFLVEPRPRRKQGVKAAEHRQHMVDLAIKDDPRLGSIHVPDARFTVHETLPRLQRRLAGASLFMLVGEDVIAHLAEWPHVDELVGEVGFIVGLRSEHRAPFEDRLRTLQQIRGGTLRHTVVEFPPTALISSTQIRRQLKTGHEPAGLLPSVLAYIRRHKLYAQ